MKKTKYSILNTKYYESPFEKLKVRKKGQTYALIQWAAKLNPKSSVRRNKYKTFFTTKLFENIFF